MPRQAPPVLESGMVGGADDCDLLSERARRGLDRAQRGYAGGGRAGRPGGGGAPGVRAWAWGRACGPLWGCGRCRKGWGAHAKARAVAGLWCWGVGRGAGCACGAGRPLVPGLGAAWCGGRAVLGGAWSWDYSAAWLSSSL